MTKPLLIVNPEASAVTGELAATIAEMLEAEVVRTERPGHATSLAREAGGRPLLVFGGDGVFNEVLNGVDPESLVGLIPGGGSSVLPRALGYPRDPIAAARILREALMAEHTRRISLGRVNGRRFAFAAAVGFPAHVVRRVDDLGRQNGRRPPDRAFAFALARELIARGGRLEPELEVDGESAAFALVANGDPYTYLARLPLRVAPKASFEDGLDVVAPRYVRARAIPSMTMAALLGRRARDTLYRHDVDRVELRCRKPLPLQVDGEDLGDVEAAVFESERGAVALLVPR